MPSAAAVPVCAAGTSLGCGAAVWDDCPHPPPLWTLPGRWPFIPQMSDGHHDQQGLVACHLVGQVSKLLARPCLLSSALPRHGSGCVYLQVEAWFARAVCGELYEVSCRMVVPPSSCRFLEFQMGKV